MVRIRKPKNKTPIHLLPVQPDCCFECPLVGLIPKGYAGKPKGSKETHVCLGTWEALTGRGIKVRASGRDCHHPLRRPCDLKWEAWAKLPGGYFMLPDEAYLQYRVPFENGLQFRIKFHSRDRVTADNEANNWIDDNEEEEGDNAENG